MPEQILVLTGEVHSGKTSKLLDWSRNRNDVYGILTPVIEGSRFFWNVQSGEQFEMEAADENEVLVVGRYRFSKNGFEKAVKILDDTINKSGWLIVDEIGPLELRGEGFSEIVKKIVHERTGKTLFVVRKALVDDVVRFFQLDRFQLSIVDVDGILPS
jgi:nucleoside-triphosphatase